MVIISERRETGEREKACNDDDAGEAIRHDDADIRLM